MRGLGLGAVFRYGGMEVCGSVLHLYSSTSVGPPEDQGSLLITSNLPETIIEPQASTQSQMVL